MSNQHCSGHHRGIDSKGILHGKQNCRRAVQLSMKVQAKVSNWNMGATPNDVRSIHSRLKSMNMSATLQRCTIPSPGFSRPSVFQAFDGRHHQQRSKELFRHGWRRQTGTGNDGGWQEASQKSQAAGRNQTFSFRDQQKGHMKREGAVGVCKWVYRCVSIYLYIGLYVCIYT